MDNLTGTTTMINRCLRITWLTSSTLIVVTGTAAFGREPDSIESKKVEAQVWRGTIQVPGMPLDFVTRFNQSEGSVEWTGTIDIPVQGAKGLALNKIKIDDKHISFTLPVGAPAEFDLTVDEDAKHAKGTMLQHGQTFEVVAERITEQESTNVGPSRPQTPKPPYPYKVEEVTFPNDKDGFTLTGTLTLPEKTGAVPAIVMITGSGTQDRDETILGHKPFQIIADYLSRRGMAVLRFDDRGAGGSKLAMDKLLVSTTEDMANDVRAAVKYLRSRDEIDAKRIGLIGHSEGGVIAPMVAADDEEIACIVMLAGCGVPGRQILPRQLERISLSAGIPRENVNRQLKAQAKWMDLLAKGAPLDELRPAVRDLVVAQVEAGGQKLDDAKIDEKVELALKAESSPWMKFFITFDPATALKRVKCPVLALNGTLDMQVIADDNLPAIESALKAGGNQNVKIVRLPGLNHLFQQATTGLPGEYGIIEETISPKALKATSLWLRKQFHIEAPKRGKKRMGSRRP